MNEMSLSPLSVESDSDQTKEKMNAQNLSSGRTLSKMKRVGIVSSYVVMFAIIVFVVIALLDAYECYSHGKFDGNIRIANIDLTSSGEIDLTMDLTADAWLQSRLHTMRVDVAGCTVKIDTPSGRHLEILQATNSLPLTIKPKSLWSAWDGSTFEGHDAPTYSVNGVIVLSHVNFTSVGTMLMDAIVVPPTDTPHTMVVECVVDGAVELFSVPAMSISLNKYVYSTRKDFHIDPPVSDGTTNGATASDRRSLTLITDIASQLKSILSSIPAIGSSLAMVSQTDYETLVSDVASSPSNILGLLFYPFSGIQSAQGDLNDKYNVAQLDIGYNLQIPAKYVPSFLVNVYVPPLAVRMSSGTPGSGWSWLVSTQSFILDLSATTFVDANINCGNKVGNCTLMTPVFGFVSNAFTNLQDTFEFDMVGEDNVVYRALGRHTDISYSAILDYQVPAPNFLVNDFGVTSCLNVTLADRWSVKNACFMKQPGQPEVDVSFDIPSFDGTSGSYFGMSSAFTWTYAALSNKPTAMPTIAPTSPPSSTPTTFPTAMPTTATPSMAPTVAPSHPTMSPSTTPTTAPTSAPTAIPTLTPSCTPTVTPTVAHTVSLFVIQEIRSLSQNEAIGSLDFAKTFADALKSLKSDPTYPIPSSVTFDLQSVTYELYCPTCGDYVTRVRYTATVLNNDGLLPIVSSNLAASVYTGTLQNFLRNTGGYGDVQVYSTGSFRAQLPGSPSSQPTSQPTRQPTRQPTSQPTRQPSSQPTRQPSSQPSTKPTTQPSGSSLAPIAPTYRPSQEGGTTQPTTQYAPTVAPSQRPTTAVPTRSPLASDGCVHIGFMALQSQTYVEQRYTVPSFGNLGDQMYYNVTLIMAGASGNIGSSGGYYESGSLSASNLNLPSEFGPFSVLAGDTGVLIRFYPYYAGSYFRATVCPFQAVPTAMPTQMLAPAVDMTAEGNALCEIGKAFNLGGDAHWPLSTVCPIDAFPAASMTNSSGVPVWCTWPFLSCDTRSKSVVAFDQGRNGNSWWIQSSTLPTAFGSLPNLQRLSLNGIRLVGTIPASIYSSLNQLTYLDMANNQLTGTIPSSINVAFVPQKGALQLDLSYNRLTGTVPSMFAKLQYMYLGNSKVQWSLSGNCFLASPIPSIRNSINSQGRCSTPHSPASIAAEGQALCQIAKALSNVVVTNVYDGQNYVTTYPFGPYVYYLQWWEGSGVKHKYTSNSTCYYDTTVPLYQPDWCAGYWSSAIGCDASYSITSLSISGNSWTKAAKIPTDIGALTNLQSLYLYKTGLSGPIPSWLGGLSRLTNLNLQYNMLTGSVPAFVANVWSPNFNYNCNLTSSIPAISSQMSNGQVGTCSDDRNTIAAEGQAICKIAQALSNVRINQWNGNTNLPKPVFSNSNGANLRYGYNPVNSTCYYNISMPLHQPDWCNSWSGIGCSNKKVTYLYISATSWTNTAKIPTAIGALTNLQSLQLTNMGLTGSIPNLMSLSRLTYLSLSNNMLTGVVPRFINRTTNNNNNQLSSNCNLTSPIPRIAARLTNQGGQNCRPAVATIAAEGQAMCAMGMAWSNMQVSQYTGHNYTRTNVFGSFSSTSTGLKRTGYIPGKTTCYYYTNATHTSMSSYQPVWCSWPGVWCTNNRVYMIQIQNPTWTKASKIPSALGALGNLQTLYLTYAGLSGSIPNLVGLSKLQTLQMYGNRLTGAVPAFINTITTRPNTQVSLTSNCNLTSTSTSPVGTNSYAYYDGQGNCAPLKPADIAAEGFALCSLTFGRTSISNWNTATGCNYNTSKPVYRPSWCDWYGVSCDSSYSINSLYVWYNTWDYDSNYLAQNNLKRTIPTSIGGLKGLTYLTLAGMGYTGPIPTALFSLTKLNYLYLQSNSLTGSIPTAIANLKQLNLYLDGNRFNGTLPAVLLNLPQLRTLSMQGNSLHGTIPSTIHKNTALNLLNLCDNSMTGSIPPGIGNLTNLQQFYLERNYHQSCNWNCNNGQCVNSCTSYGGFNGTLPAEFYTLKSLESTHLDGNKLSGTISPMISRLTNLQDIRFSGNSFSGTIPSSISSFTNLFNVNLDNNRFTGTIPKIFGNLRQNGNSYQLLLHNNYLTGAVPSMPFSYGQFRYTFDQNCQLTSSLVYLGSQMNCKPGTAGQRPPIALPPPTPSPVVPLPASDVSYVQISFTLNMYFNQINNIYPNNTAALDPKAPTALANAFADVLFLPHSAVSINSYNFVGYHGCGIGSYCDPSTTASLTVLYQGTGLTPRANAISDAFYEIISAVTWPYIEQSPLGNALIQYGYPNANTLYQIDGQTMVSKSYTAGQPTPAPTTTPAPTKAPIANYGTTKLNATSVGDNVTTISHLNYQRNENFYWYISPPRGVAKGIKLIYTLHFPVFGTEQWNDRLYVGGPLFKTTGSWDASCTGPSCADIQIISTTGVTLYFNSYYWSSGNMPGFIAQLTWQIYKPPNFVAEGLALCSLNLGRSTLNGWNTATGCYYNTSKPLYQPPWCSWSGVSCDSSYSINSLQVWYSYWDYNYLAQNNLKRTIPTSIAGLKGLTSLSFYNMGYTGPIPTALFSLTKLNSLELSYNALTGSIPSAIASLKQLIELRIDNNRINGTVPAALLNLPQLRTLSMQGNSLSGLPSAIRKNTALRQLSLNNNRMAGTIPPAIGNLTNLQQLDLSYNTRRSCDWNYNYVSQNWESSCTSSGGLRGTLPASLYTLKSLQYMRLSGNGLTGTISPFISNLTNLGSVQLSGNRLNGTIPSSFFYLNNLYELTLDNNYFTGKIPKVFRNLNVYIKNGMWYRLLLHNNYLTGAIPSMAYSYGPLTVTFDLNCQLTSTYPAVILSSQTHCKPGAAGQQQAATAFPSPSPTPSPTVLPGLPYVRETFNLRLYYSWIQVYGYSAYYNQYTYMTTYPNMTAMSNPTASLALSNAIADVLSLPHSAVSINSYNSFGYLGGTNIGSQSSQYTSATLTVLYQGTAQTTGALTTRGIGNAHTTASNAFNVVDRSLQTTTSTPTFLPTRPPTLSPSSSSPSSSSPSSVTVLTESGIYSEFYSAINAFMNYHYSHSYDANLSPLGIALRTYGFPNDAYINQANLQQMSSSSYISPTPTPTASPSTSGPTIKDAPTKPPVTLRFTGAPSTVIPPLDPKNFVMPGLATVFTTFCGDIHIRGKQGQPTLNSLVNIVLQAVGENALPRSPQRLPLELGSVMHDGSFKYDLSTLLRTGEANFTGNAIVDGNQLLGPVQGLFQALYFIGEIAVQFDQYAPAYLQGAPIVRFNATASPSSAPSLPRPTFSPSFEPTFTPSALPSFLPTQAPTATPSLAPTSAPSARPSFVPTMAPTLSEATQLTIKLQNYLSSNLTQNSSASSHSSLSVLYQEVVARGAMPAVGGCSNWKVSTGSALSTSLLTQVATSVSMFVYNDNNNVGTTVQCNVGTSATNIIKAISNAGVTVTNVTCAGHTWRVQRCKGTRTSLCVDCANPCVATPTTCSSLKTFNPCGGTTGTEGGGAGYGCTALQSTVNMFRVLSGTFQLNPAFIPPVINTLSVVAAKTTAVVTAVLSDDGTVYCGAFPTTTVPTSISQITSQNFVAASASGTAHVSMTGLSPKTTYAVYCLTQSSLGTLASLSTAIKFKITMTTLCCKKITVAINIDSIFQGSSAGNAVQVTMDALPSSIGKLVISMGASDSAAAISSLIPGDFSVTSASGLIPLYASIGTASTVNTGTVTVTAVLSGEAASEYEIEYTQGQSFGVLAITQPLPPPTLSSVSFSADGTALVASLSADSNLAGITQAHFPCSQLFTFTAASGLNATKCSWTDPSEIHITLDSNAAINVGGSVALRSGHIRAACPATVTNKTCAGWSTTAFSTSTVLAPVSPVIPTVAISAPSIIGMCDAFPIDVTSSVGSSGRVWSNISFAIKSTNSSGIAKALHFLNKQYVFSPPSSVPAGYFAAGISQITVRMCNFLGACGTASIQLAVTSFQAPVVTIGGDQSFSTTVATPLSINGDGYVSICNYTAVGGAMPAVSHSGLSFQWAAYVAGTQDFSLVSYSKQYYSYKLAPYSLIAGKTYTFTLTVIDDSTSLSSTRSVQVIVVSSAVVAVISQGSVASVYQAGDITLSAAMSYDMDKFGVTGAAAGLSFSWTCAQSLPVISTSCSFTLPSGSSAQSLVLVAASSLAVGTTSVVTVYVTSAGRTSTASITVAVISNDRPLVGVTAFDIVGKVVPEHPLALSGVSLTTAGGYDSWTASDSSVVLSSLSLTPSQNVFVSSGLSTVLLVLPAYSLTPGSSLTFTLSCRSKTTGFSSSASLSVVVNSPPQGGVFIVKPSHGRELTDTFTFSASRWWDTDLPINYAFGFVSPSSGSLSVVQSLSQRIYTTTSLPAGQDTSNYTLACQMLVYDSYLSSTAATQTIQVKPSVVSNNDLEKQVSSQLSNPATATKVLGVVVALINNVKCTFAPNCTTLNRLPCKAVTNTCGSCASSNMIGVFKDSNAPCLTLSQAIAYGSSHRRRLAAAPSKTCLNDCGGSGVGTCGFVSANTFAAVTTCVLTDPTCTAVCACVSGFYGPSCALSLTDLQSQQSLRALLLSGFYNSTTSTDATADTVTAWTAQVVSLTRSYETLTPTAMNIAVKLLQAIVTNAAHLQLPSGVVVGVLGACDALAQAVLLNNPTASSLTVSPVVQQLMGLMEKYSSLALGQMNAMQYDSTLTSYQTFKSISAVKSVVTSSGSSSSITVNIPPTATESLANTVQASVALTNIVAGVANVKVGLVETKAHLFDATQTPHSRRRLSTSKSWQSSLSVTSNLIKVVLPDVTVCGSASTSACIVTVTLPTVTTETYDNGAAAAAAAAWTVTCNIGVANTVTNPNPCPDLSYLTTVCSGGAVAYTYTQTCPWLVVAPTCGRIVAGTSSTLNVATDVCTTVSFTATSAICSCSLSVTSLLTDNSGSSNAGSVQLASVTTTNRLSTAAVTVYLSAAPSYHPTPSPSTATPTYDPTYNPTTVPSTYNPTTIPSTTPTTPGMDSPTRAPSTLTPTKYPTYTPTCKPTQLPTTAVPSFSPTPEPTHPTYEPTMEPTHPTYEPTAEPSTVAPSATPSTEPSLNPTFAPVSVNAPVVTVQATQTVAGVTSDSVDFRTAFASAVMSLLPTGSSVTIVSVTVIEVRRRQLLTTAVSVVYTVQSTAPASTLTSSLSSGTAAMTAVLQQTYPAASVTAPVVVTITVAPTGAPVATSGSKVNFVGAVAGSVVGFVALLLIVGGLTYQRQQNLKKKILVDVPQVDEEGREFSDPFKGSVRIEGATGSNATGINGVYEATDELSGDMPVYVKVGDPNVWLEYRAARKQWQVKPITAKGTDGTWAFCAVPDKCLPQDAPKNQWKVVPGFVSQPTIIVSSVSSQQEVEAYRRTHIKPIHGDDSPWIVSRFMARVSTALTLAASQRSSNHSHSQRNDH